MSQENVELIRGVYEHFNRTAEPLWDVFHPDAEFDATGVVGLGSYSLSVGREEIVRVLGEYTAAFEDWRIEPEELIDAGEHVVAVVRDGGRLRGTDDTVYNNFTHVWTLRSGKVVRWKTFTDHAEALKAAGLEE